MNNLLTLKNDLLGFKNLAGLTICIWLFTIPVKSQITLPYLDQAVTIDGNLNEWKDYAFHDGAWDIHRLQASNWYEPSRNRITDHGENVSPEDDLTARYYMAWDEEWLYLGAIVHDNVNDLLPSKPGPHRWYYKDCVAWFFEAPGDTVKETFGEGNHAFCFVADPTKPSNGAWWRHGNSDTTFLEEPLPRQSVEFEIHMQGDSLSPGSFTLEAKVRMQDTFGTSDPKWKTPHQGDCYRMMIVHTDPDGGGYGGHFLIYGKGDPDQSWHWITLGGPKAPIIRKPK